MANPSAREAVTVRIDGEDHTIRANVEPEHTRRCAQWVDDRISEIRGQLGLIETHKAAILAALSITDEMFQARAEVDEFKDAAATRAQALALKLEEVLAEEVAPEPEVPETGEVTREAGEEPVETGDLFEGGQAEG